MWKKTIIPACEKFEFLKFLKIKNMRDIQHQNQQQKTDKWRPNFFLYIVCQKQNRSNWTPIPEF
jgi:hypothetical protein